MVPCRQNETTKSLEVLQVEHGQKDSSSITVWSNHEPEGLQHNLQIPNDGAQSPLPFPLLKG